MVTVADCLNFDEDARLERQTLHKFAWSEIIDVLGQFNFLRVLPVAWKVFCRDTRRYTSVYRDIAATRCVAEMARACRSTASFEYLCLVHIFKDELSAATKAEGRGTGQKQYQGNRRYEGALSVCYSHVQYLVVSLD